MLNDIYTISIWITIGITFIFCLFLCVLSIPQTQHLHNYRIARYVMACAYLSLGIMNIVELIVQPGIMDVRSSKMIALLVCLFQSFLFTYTNITLINIHFATKRKILFELTPIVLFCILTPVVIATNSSPKYLNILFYAFIIYYISILFRYTILFHKNYRDYILKMDNFYAGQESKRFRWINLSFYSALAMGIMALFVTLFFSIVIGILFSLFIIGFYSYYGIQFINYVFLFQYIEAAIAEEKNGKESNETSNHIRNYSLLEMNVEKWIADKKFLEQTINIENAALQLHTNRTYLSDYVNTFLRKTFKEWISELRIKEAGSLLLEYPDLSISKVSEMVGFSDNSNFGRLFVKYMGMSPKTWRMSKLNSELQISYLDNGIGKN